jgi:hypothetical protein
VIGKCHGYAADHRFSENGGEVIRIGEHQQQQLAAVRSEIPEGHGAAAAMQPTAAARPENTQGAAAVETLQATASRPSQPMVATAVSPLQRVTYSSPWLIDPYTVRPTWSRQRRQATILHFLIVFSAEPPSAVSVIRTNSLRRIKANRERSDGGRQDMSAHRQAFGRVA